MVFFQIRGYVLGLHSARYAQSNGGEHTPLYLDKPPIQSREYPRNPFSAWQSSIVNKYICKSCIAIYTIRHVCDATARQELSYIHFPHEEAEELASL